ncbi:MAG: ribonuclease HII [Ignavibacteria bacterium]|nr:ribonuclease HII [Ignavibacteria bacterium]
MKTLVSGISRSLFDFDNSIRKKGGLLCGVDEAGRGPIAGPVVAAAVIFPDDVYIEGVNDSKKLSHNKREELYEEIINSCICWAVGIVDNKTIDELNILNATTEAMNTAICKLSNKPSVIIADGNFYDKGNEKVTNLVRADEQSFSVAAASIIAKVTRDRIMCEYENEFPHFSFSVHKGYCTSKHIDEILEFGYTQIHRRSFKLKVLQGELF